MYEPTQDLESIAENFISMNENYIFMKQQITKLDKTQLLGLNFKNCHVAISKNGGLIAICKKKGFMGVMKDEKQFEDNVIVMHQDAKVRYDIRIDWDYNKKYIVCFDFTEDEQLYGICNDGSIFKFDILTLKAKEKSKSQKFDEEKIDKAVLFEKGFVCLTEAGNFYLINNIKDPVPQLLFPMKKLLDFNNKVPFLIIPGEKISKSGKVELLLGNQKGPGLIRVEFTENGNYNKTRNKDGNYFISNVTIMIKDKFNKLILTNDGKISDEENTESRGDAIGIVTALAISPQKSQIAVYNKERQIVSFFHSSLDNNPSRYPKKIARFTPEDDNALDEDDNEKLTNENERKSILYEFPEGSQFLFCGEDAVVISGKRFACLINGLNKTIIYKICENVDPMSATVKVSFSKCISENDGLRCLTDNSVIFIGKIPKEMYKTCELFDINSPPKKLISAYQNLISKNPNCDKDIRAISSQLSDAINSLKITSANLYWNEDNENKDKNKKKLQEYLIKAAQYGKSFVQKGEFNFVEFVNTCKDIRIINNLWNCKKSPRFITFSEYKSLSGKKLIERILRQHNYLLAYEITEFLDYDDRIVYHKYALANIKKLCLGASAERQERLFKNIVNKLRKIENVNYIKLASKSFNLGHEVLGDKFLEMEKSPLIKIPEMLQRKKWEQALKLSFKTYDRNVILTVLDKIFKVESVNEFIRIVGKYNECGSAVIEYLKKNDHLKELEDYLTSVTQNENEEKFYYYLEQFFGSNDIKERKNILKLANDAVNALKSNKNFDASYYITYLKDLKYSLQFKEECIKKDIILKTDTTSFDNSITDCYKSALKTNNEKNIKYVEDQLINKFNIGVKKVNLLKIRFYCEQKNFEKIKNLLGDVPNAKNLKKLELAPQHVVDIMVEYPEFKEETTKYVLIIDDLSLTEYKVDILKGLGKFDLALVEAAKDCKNENLQYIFNDILRRKPDLRQKAKDLISQYKLRVSI